jgi:Family of unknown function (DUF5824)
MENKKVRRIVEFFNNRRENKTQLATTRELSGFAVAKHFKSFVPLTESAYNSLVKKSEKSGIPISTLKMVYERGVETWFESKQDEHTPQQIGFARVNAYINKGKSYYEDDKDLHNNK